MGQRITISLSGRVSLAVEGHPALDFELGPLARVAFAYLVMERGRPVTRDELADALWGDDAPPTWRSALRGIVSRLRRFLDGAGLRGTECLVNVGGCYELRLADAEVDVEVARAILAGATASLAGGDGATARRHAAAAGELTHGQFAAGGRGVWVESQQHALSELHVQALELLADAAVAEGDAASALRAAEAAVALRPLRESAHQRVMAAHALAGNRGEALRAHERCRRVLREELGVAPSSQTEAAYLTLLSPGPKTSPPRGGLAPDHFAPGGPGSATSFVGRQRLIAEIQRRVGEGRLVSLLGPGGVGKSRAALEAAKTVAGNYPDGVCVVALADVADPGLVALQLLAALHLPEGPGGPQASLTSQLAGKRMLVVLDNCEQVAAGCAELVDGLLQTCAGVTFLTTSRQLLGVPGEVLVPVRPLEPDEAVQLFVDRALAVAPTLDVAVVTADVADICRGLDGIPLAIELAAARVRTLAVPELARRLDDRFRWLVGGPARGPARHRTLRAAIDWSYEALEPGEQQLFADLAVFSGGFTLSAAEAVCSPGSVGVVEGVSDLVDRSLVEASQVSGSIRYRMLETLRRYAWDCLVASGRAPDMRDRHLAWVHDLARQAGAALDGDDQAYWLDLLHAEHENIRCALEWAAGRDHHAGLQTAAWIWRYFEVRGHLSEGRSWLETFSGPDESELESAETAPTTTRALAAAGALAQRQRDFSGARALLHRSLALCRRLGDERGAAVALHGLANVEVGEGNLADARQRFEEQATAARALGDVPMLAASLLNLGVVTQLLFVSEHGSRADAERASQLYEESLGLYRTMGDRKGIALALENLGAVAPHVSDYDTARRYLEQSLAIRRQLGDRIGIAATTRFLAHVAVRTGRLKAARGLQQESLTIERALGNRALAAEDLASLARIAEAEGDVAEAHRLLEESLALFAELGDSRGTERVLAHMGQLAEAGRA